MTSMLAGGILVAMAVFGWGVPLANLVNAAWLSFLIVLLLALPAALLVLMIFLVRRFRAGQESANEIEDVDNSERK